MSIEMIISLLAALGVGGILGAIVNTYLDQRKQTKEHDLKIFKESSEILSEGKLSDIVNYELLSDHAIKGDDYKKLKEWCFFFDEVGNQYLNRKLVKQSQLLQKDLIRLVKFITYNFFYLRGQDFHSGIEYLYPDLNIDRGGTAETMQKYEKYAKELEELTNKAYSQYRKYRLSVKQILKA